MPRLLLGAAVVAATTPLAVPASSSAAVTGVLDMPCYTRVPSVPNTPSDTITVQLSGGTPGGNYVLAATVPGGPGVGSAGSADGMFDPAGNATAQIPDVDTPTGTIDPTGGQPVTLSIEDFGTGPNPAEQPLGTALITNFAMNIDLKNPRVNARRTVSVSGAPFAGKTIYGLLVHGKTGKHIIRRVTLGKASSPCGFVTRKVTIAPKSLATGNYWLYLSPTHSLKDKLIGKGLSLTRF